MIQLVSRQHLHFLRVSFPRQLCRPANSALHRPPSMTRSFRHRQINFLLQGSQPVRPGANQRHLPESERAEKVIFVITTDGLENASKRFGYEKIRRMIEREKEQYGWEFLFLGANMDAVKEAARFGISSDRAVRFENDAQGVAVNYHVVSETVSRMREAPCCASIGAEWKEQIEADFQKRHHR